MAEATETKVVQVKREDAQKLVEHLGFKTASKWDNAKMASKLAKTKEVYDESEHKTDDEAVSNTLVTVLAAIEEGSDIEVTGDDPTPKESKPEKAKKGNGKAKKDKKEKKEKRPGVIKTIQAAVEEATEENPVSKEQILEKLVEAFPERSADSMKTTINVQVPNRLAKDKGLDIKKNDKGYFTA